MVKIPLRPPPVTFATLNGLDVDVVARARQGRYLHWDDVRHRTPPPGLTAEQWWAALKLPRLFGGRREVPLRPIAGHSFTYAMPDEVQESLLTVDHQLAGRIATGDRLLNEATRDRYLVSSLSEEAIRSSQLEGASTTRAVAKEMLRTGRPPRSRGEQMILNNFHAMQFVREHQDDPLTPELVCELQRIVTQDTLDDPSDAGRLQQPGDVRVRVYGDNDLVLHTPPPAEELPERLDAMCDFANGGGTGFVHPVVRSILLHFWLAYDHPFADGNGRTARALFYWSMLRHGYWITQFVSISSVLNDAPAQYARSFLLTETDDNDLTYFLIYQLRVIVRATKAFDDYVERKARELRTTEGFVKQSGLLNHRQLALVGHALRHPDAVYTVQSHRRSHAVVYETARTDLLDLVRLGLLVQRKVGKAYRFTPVPDLAGALQTL